MSLAVDNNCVLAQNKVIVVDMHVLRKVFFNIGFRIKYQSPLQLGLTYVRLAKATRKKATRNN